MSYQITLVAFHQKPPWTPSKCNGGPSGQLNSAVGRRSRSDFYLCVGHAATSSLRRMPLIASENRSFVAEVDPHEGVRQFNASYPRAIRIMPALAAVASVSSIGAWWLSRRRLTRYLVGGIAVGAAMPFTFAVIMPINKRLQEHCLECCRGPWPAEQVVIAAQRAHTARCRGCSGAAASISISAVVQCVSDKAVGRALQPDALLVMGLTLWLAFQGQRRRAMQMSAS